MGFSKAIITFLWKVITYKGGANAFFSFLTSFWMTTTLWFSGVIDFGKFNNIFLKDVDPKLIFLPALIEAGMIVIFMPLTACDFVLGLRVARVVKNESYKAERFFDTVIKSIAVILITSVIMFLAFVVVSAGYNWLWPVMIFFLCFLWAACNSYEFSSIGNNLEKLNGYKPSFFLFFDKIFSILREKAIKKVETSFNTLDDEKKDDNNAS